MWYLLCENSSSWPKLFIKTPLLLFKHMEKNSSHEFSDSSAGFRLWLLSGKFPTPDPGFRLTTPPHFRKFPRLRIRIATIDSWSYTFQKCSDSRLLHLWEIFLTPNPGLRLTTPDPTPSIKFIDSETRAPTHDSYTFQKIYRLCKKSPNTF